jgi:HlyD family secretion protein
MHDSFAFKEVATTRIFDAQATVISTSGARRVDNLQIRTKLWQWRWPALAVVLAVAAAGYWLTPVLLGPVLPAFTVARNELVQTVVASGRVESPSRIDIGSQVTGQVAAVPVSEGQSVKAGETLIMLENSDEKATLAQARAAVSQAEARLRQIGELSRPVAQQALAQAEANFANAQKQYDRAKDLAAKGFVGKSQMDDAERNLAVATSQVETARLQLQSNRKDGTDFAIAQTNLQQARASLMAALAKLGHTTILAPVAGTLISRNVERGDVVQPGKALMVLSPAGPTQLVVQIDEKNLRYLAIGQKALAAADAYPDKRFPVALTYINPGIDSARGAVEVKLDVPSPPDYLRQDMTVSVDIEVARLSNALSLPPAAIRDAAGSTPWVMLIVDGRAEKRRVKLGARGDTRVEILDGLVEGDRVLPATGRTVAEGKPVRAATPADAPGR